MITRECSKEHIPRAELPVGVGSCSTHKYSRSVRHKVVRAASATTCVMTDDELHTKMATLWAQKTCRNNTLSSRLGFMEVREGLSAAMGHVLVRF